jgi:hypothetical protein
MLVAGLFTSVILSLIVAGAIWLRTRLRRSRGAKDGGAT